jgi:tripeptidyl-peptidase-1
MLFAYALLLYAASAIGVQRLANHTLHERRFALHAGWVKDGQPALDMTLPLRFVLAQSNLDHIEEYLMNVSDPDSRHYGQHWTADQIKRTFAPSNESISMVVNWISATGIHENRITKKGYWLDLQYVLSFPD